MHFNPGRKSFQLCTKVNFIKADFTGWFCGRNHYKYEQFCAIGNYGGCEQIVEVRILIFTCREQELNFLETATSRGFHGKAHCK